MKKPNSWPTDEQINNQVPAYRRLRPLSDEVVHYIVGEQELLAVRGANPYGVFTDNSESGDKNLLSVVERTRHSTVFSVPEDTLSLRAITLGTGASKANILQNTYYKVGEAIGRFANLAPIPELSVDDFAVARKEHDILFVPPVDAGDGSQDLELHGDAFASAMQDSFGYLWRPEDFGLLKNELHRGIAYAVGER